jgi:hypothetical protein
MGRKIGKEKKCNECRFREKETKKGTLEAGSRSKERPNKSAFL